MDIWTVLQWDLQILVQVHGVQVLKVHLTLQHLQAQVVASLDQIQRNLTPLMLVDGWMLVLVAGITIMAGAAVATSGISTTPASAIHRSEAAASFTTSTFALIIITEENF
jgi:hypothetical protein